MKRRLVRSTNTRATTSASASLLPTTAATAATAAATVSSSSFATSTQPPPQQFNNYHLRVRFSFCKSRSSTRQLLVVVGVLVLLLFFCSGILILLWNVVHYETRPVSFTISSLHEFWNKDNNNNNDNDLPRTLQLWDELHQSHHSNNGGGPRFVHVVHSRFMQEQGHLVALAQARLLLFQVFCLPTMVHQSSSQFIWIIKTDPNLNTSVLKRLVQLVQPYPHIYVVASHTNFLVNQNVTGMWRGAQVQELQTRSIYSGNRTRLVLAMALADHLPVIETRLDADDGLHKDYLRYIQHQAMLVFGTSSDNDKDDDKNDDSDDDDDSTTSSRGKHNNRNQLTYKYFCSKRSLEWHWALQQQQQQHSLDGKERDGMLQVVIHSKMCITPGISVAYPVGVTDRDVPVVQHNLLLHRLLENTTGLPCGAAEPQGCIGFVDGFIFDAIRSRTPTSAGMMQVFLPVEDEPTASSFSDISNNNSIGNELPRADSAAVAAAAAAGGPLQPLEQYSPWMQYAFWHFLYDSFGISRHQVEYVQSYLQRRNLYDLARDNLMGQCTSFHSCKESAKKDLEAILEATQR